MQLSLELIPHIVGREIIQQRAKDGYINATAMCKAAAKFWFDYRRQKTTDPYLAALSAETGIPATELIQSLSSSATLFRAGIGGALTRPVSAAYDRPSCSGRSKRELRRADAVIGFERAGRRS